MTYRILTVLAALSALIALPAHGQPATPLPADATPAETAAYQTLEKHCARRHKDGALKEGLTQPKSGFGHVLDIRRLAQDTKFVVQGDVTGSKLYNVVGEWSFPSKPDDCSEISCYPSQAEADAVATWIEALGQSAPPPRTYVSMPEMFALAHDDLLAQPTNRRERIRYLSLRVLHNDTDVSEENLEGYRASTVKLINALSWNPKAFRAEPVDEHGILIRIFLPDIDWDHARWSLLEQSYPYGPTGTTDPRLSQLQQASGTQMPVIRADWFASRAPVSPLYYDLLGLPDTVQGLEALLRIDMARNIRDEQVIRAGFQNSGVSTHNRLIERHPLGTGFFWTSYDFAGSKERQSLFEYPLGPTSAFSEEFAFLHDGGESIFTLPNGFHAYYLNTADGARLDVGPTQIVRDDDYSDGNSHIPAADLSYSVAAVVDDYVGPATKSADPGYDPTDYSVQSRAALTIYNDKPAYKVGEGLRIFVEPRRDCRLTLINIDDRGKSCVLYPHPSLPDVPIRGGSRYVFPPTGSLTAKEAGEETILAICNGAPEAVKSVTRDTSRVSCYASQRRTDYEQILHREIIREVLSLDLSANDKIADNGTTYKGLSSQNPHVAKAQISAPVSDY